MKIDKKQFWLHLPWALLALLVLVGCGAYYSMESLAAGTWLRGGSQAGLACGLAAGAIIVFEMLLWPRKYFRKLRLIPAKHWMSAHIWLGLASAPLAVLHTGFHWGGTLPSIFLVLFLLTILSGIYGLILQSILPALKTKLLPGETIYSQIDHVSRLIANDLRLQIQSSCTHPFPDDTDSDLPVPVASEAAPGLVTIGRTRGEGRLRGRVLRREPGDEAESKISDPEICSLIMTFYRSELRPFLLDEKQGTHLRDDAHASNLFSQASKEWGEAAIDLVANMREAHQQKQQFNLQKRMHRWLHAWIPVHVALSVAVTVLLLAHVITALRYW